MVEQFYSPAGLTLPLGAFSYPFSILWIMLVIRHLPRAVMRRVGF